MKGMTLRVFVGATAALAGWAVTEPFAPKLANDPNWDSWQFWFVATFGLLVGAAIGAATGFMTGGAAHTKRGLLFGGALGAVGILLGSAIGGALSTGMFGAGWESHGSLLVVLPARVVALTPIGALLGLAIGISTLSPQRAKYGLIGGALAGAIGGALFDLIGDMTGEMVRVARHLPADAPAEIGSLSRAIYAVILGGGIGLFIAIVENIAKSAWLRQELGRNEGKEWPLYSDTSVIGRAETATVPIFSDPALQPFHASIFRSAGAYSIVDNGGGVLLNGQPVAQAPLFSGAQIQLANTRLTFLMKDSHAPQYAPEYGTPAVPTPVPTPSQFASPAQPVVPGPYPAPAAGSQAAIPTQAMPAAQAAVSLLATDGPLNGQRFPILFPIEVGRTCPTIPLSYDTMASRRHASLAPTPGGILVTDLGSTNGTFVNGSRVQQALAALGHTIKIGSTTFRVE